MEHFYNNIPGWFDFQDLYKKIVDTFSSGSHFVEVGAWKGKSTAFLITEIINSGKDIRLDVVDHFKGSDETEHKDDPDLPNLQDVFRSNLKSVIDKINVIPKASNTAAQKYKNNSLDFVFLDASHDYKNVITDLKCWYPKIKPGGILGGHDYTFSKFEVGQAVNDFCKENNLSIQVLNNSFLIQKDKEIL